ncbi:major facilitator superfamily-domain-containing protein [Bisporella sp. PMI_857]|nr:major facilitator superfamily-domain-containing protein [Bisporella sp. PMI_857]
MEKDIEREAVAVPGVAGDADSHKTNQDQENIVTDNILSDSPGSTAINEDGSATSHEGAPVHNGAKPTEPEASRTRLQTTIIMASLCCSVFLAALDVSIITTALPTISQHFGSSAGYTWIGSAYLLANAASTPSWGKFSDIWGRKPILLCASMIFFIGSLLAGVSVSIGMLIVARAIQGIGGGGLIILVNICIGDLFSMRNRGQYYGMVGMVWALASSVGPVFGGLFTEKVSWRWCFYINLPITGTVTVVLYFFLHLDNPRTPVWDGLKAVDWIGSFTIVGGTLMFLLGLEFGGVTYPWDSVTVICLIVFGILVAGLFILNEWKFARYPIMPIRLFNNSSSIAAFGVCFCHGFIFIAGSYYLPLYFQAVIGATPLLSGVYLIPFALTLSLVSGGTGIFIKKTGNYLPPIRFGMTVLALGMGLLINLGPTANWAKIICYQVVAGIGVGPNFQSPLLAIQSRIAPSDIATATGTFGFIRNLSTSISVVIGSVVFQNEMNKKRGRLIAALGPEAASRLSGGAAGSNIEFADQLPPEQRAVARTAFNESLQRMWIVYVAFAGLGILVSLFVRRNVLSREHQVTKTGLQAEEARRMAIKEEKKQARINREARQSQDAGELVNKEEV